MSEFMQIFPSSLIGYFNFLGVVLLSIMFFLFQIRKNDMAILRQSNDDLRSAHDDNTKKIEELQKQVKELTVKVQVLETTNKTLEDLVKSALEHFFKSNPKMAFEIAKVIQDEKKI